MNSMEEFTTPNLIISTTTSSTTNMQQGNKNVSGNLMRNSLPPPPPPMIMNMFNQGFQYNTSVNGSSATLISPFTSMPPPKFANMQQKANQSTTVSKTSSVSNNCTSASSTIAPKGPSWGRLRLVGEACSDAPPEFLLSDTKINIGRGLNSHVKIVSNTLSKFVSRNHADIVKMNDYTFLISDLGSTNGTLLNGKKIGKDTDLKHGDLIIITGGVKALVGDYIILENGKRRSDFSTEQEWKCALIGNVKNAFMYKFEMLQNQFIPKNLNPTKSAINLKVDEEFTEPPVVVTPKSTQPQPLTGKRVREEKEESVDFESGSKKLKEEKFNKFAQDCCNEFSCTICCNLMYEPTVLECGHNFCRKCLHDWLAKNKSCPLCRKKLSQSSAPNRAVETLLKIYVENCAPEEDVKDYEERIKAIKIKDDENFAKLATLVENAKIKKIKFLDITVRWKLEEKRTFKTGVKQYFGKCRDEFCKLVGITENYVINCNNEQLLIACENLELPVAYMIVGQEIKTMRRVIDFDQTRQNIVTFWNAKDNIL